MLDVFSIDFDHDSMVQFLTSDDPRAVVVNGLVSQVSDWDEIESCWDVYIPHSNNLEVKGEIDVINGTDIYQVFLEWCRIHEISGPSFMTFIPGGLKLTNSIQM